MQLAACFYYIYSSATKTSFFAKASILYKNKTMLSLVTTEAIGATTTVPAYIPSIVKTSLTLLYQTDRQKVTTNAYSIINLTTSTVALPVSSLNSSNTAAVNSSSSFMPMRLVLTISHLLLVSLGSVNLLVIFVILLRPYMRSITNVYMLSLCLADFIYLTNLLLVAATQLNNKSWPFGSIMCTLYHGTETTGKYASVLFVVLLALDRYCAMCQSIKCSQYRNFRVAIILSLVAWTLAILSAFPLYYFAEVALLKFRNVQKIHKLCIAKWPNSDSARW